ncbi:YigZ family protein [Leuconostoc fallax]|uniref:Impact N-terminal domain-containing protein n=1 Tax=Leuconostoc fallax TaxID=1251 RepID=A0A4R5NBQ5_9LACO|nr:YigZ family protein [Leuconostoc fallax]MBU7454966.1 YigZ family protein [Leuconostoc fallax]MCO6183242.1 YigZ family protein [Leuconostoc fallax]TDG69531.1 hypothetical protein C5L23_000993 [Leuconostoc fallax]
MTQYLTIQPQQFTWEQDIKKSRFILNIARVTTEEQAQAFINQMNKQHHKATHNVFAYMLGDTDHIQRYSDNGEPSGTAGVPMLEVLQKRGLHDIVAVVTRYFGGIKLGAGGLIRAYSGTVADGLTQTTLVQRVTRQAITITTSYKNHPILEHWLTEHDFEIMRTEYDTAVHIVVPVAEATVTDFIAQVTDLLAGNATTSIGETIFFEIPMT